MNMKGRQKTYEDKIDEEMGKLDAQIAWLKAGDGLARVEADIKFYKTIEAFIVAEERGEWSC